MFKYTDWLISDKLINCVACVAKKARDDSGIKPLYVEVDPTKLAGITYTGTQMMHKEPDDFVTFREKKSDKAAKERDTFNYHSEVNAGQAAFMYVNRHSIGRCFIGHSSRSLRAALPTVIPTHLFLSAVFF